MLLCFSSLICYGHVTWWIEFFWKQIEDYVLFEQMIREILKEGSKEDGATMAPATTGGTEARIIGIKHW